MGIDLVTCWRIAKTCADYEPLPIGYFRVRAFLRQFDRQDRSLALKLLQHVSYLSQDETTKVLLDINDKLQAYLRSQGLLPRELIYVTVHDAGSSSPVMLNILKNHHQLERRGNKCLDSKDIFEIEALTYSTGQGAIIYVDDFAGTGNQFVGVRNSVAPYIRGSFAEFFLLPAICEEAFAKIDALGIVPIAGLVHKKMERPLHPDSEIFTSEERERLTELCLDIHNQFGLGYKRLATMVILARNAPNTVPLVLRRSRRQRLWRGLFPRWDDLPLPKLPRD